MDDKMMKAGGAQKRAELVKMFGDLSISTAQTREYTEQERRIANQGDIGQGERLARRQ